MSAPSNASSAVLVTRTGARVTPASCRANASRDSGRRLVTLISSRSNISSSRTKFQNAGPRAPRGRAPRGPAGGDQRGVHDRQRYPGAGVVERQQPELAGQSAGVIVHEVADHLDPGQPARPKPWQVPAEHVEMAGVPVAGYQVHPRLEHGAALAVSEDRAFHGSHDLRAGQAECVDVRTGQEADPQARVRHLLVHGGVCGSALGRVVQEDVADCGRVGAASGLRGGRQVVVEVAVDDGGLVQQQGLDLPGDRLLVDRSTVAMYWLTRLSY